MNEPTDNGTQNTYKGTSGLAFNTEIDFTEKFDKLEYFGLNTYLFADIGVIKKIKLEINLHLADQILI